MKNFLDTFTSTDPYKTSFEQNWLLFKGAVHEALEKYVPKCQIKTLRRIPWITYAIELKMKKRKQLYDRARKTQTHESWEAYRIMRNQITKKYLRHIQTIKLKFLKITLALFQKDFGST